MQAKHFLLLAGAALVVTACSDQMPTTPRQAAHGPPSSSLGVSALCPGTFSTAFSPAATNQNQAVVVVVDENYNCTVGASSASSFSTYSEPALNCGGALVNLAPQDQILSWTGGTGPSTSTIHYTSQTMVASALVSEGTVTAGRFIGDAAKRVQVVVTVQGSGSPGLCVLGLGTISRVSGTSVLTIASLDV